MATIYLVRHQAAGALWQFPFAESPSEAQQAVLATYCARLYGDVHPKTKEFYWTRIETLDLVGPSDEPRAFIPVGGSTKDNVASAGQFGVSGVGTVTPKAEV